MGSLVLLWGGRSSRSRFFITTRNMRLARRLPILSRTILNGMRIYLNRRAAGRPWLLIFSLNLERGKPSKMFLEKVLGSPSLSLGQTFSKHIFDGSMGHLPRVSLLC